MSCRAQAQQAVWSGEFTLFGVTLRCHVLADGQRIVDAEDFQRVLNVMGGGDCPALDPDEAARFARWQSGQ